LISGGEATTVPISSDRKALIFTYGSETAADDAVSYIITTALDDLERSHLGNVVILFEAVPDPALREAIESCAARGEPITAQPPGIGGFAELETVAGTLIVVDAYTTDEYPLDCRTNGEDFCDATSSEERIVVVLLEHEKGSFTENEADALADEAFESFLIDGQGFTVDSSVVAWSTDFQGGVGTITEIEVVYTSLPADLPTTIELNWPDHDPIDVTPLIEQ